MNTSKSVNIMIVDDHDMVRQGIESVIKTVPEFTILYTASSGEDALDILRDNSKKPDILLLDIVMPNMDGLEISSVVKREFPDIKILILSMEISSEYVKKAVKNDVDGYIPKNADIDILITAIKRIVAGSKYFDDKIKDFIFKHFVKDDEITTPKVENLSDREVQVLKMISNGITNRDIGEKLFISPKTVEAHRNNILKKLGLKSTADLVKFAIARHITDIPKEMLDKED